MWLYHFLFSCHHHVILKKMHMTKFYLISWQSDTCALTERERERERVPLKNVLSTRDSEKGRSMSWYLVCCLSSNFFLPMFQPNKLNGLRFHPYETVFEMQQAICSLQMTNPYLPLFHLRPQKNHQNHNLSFKPSLPIEWHMSLCYWFDQSSIRKPKGPIVWSILWSGPC